MLSKNPPELSIKRSFVRRFVSGAIIAWVILSLFSYQATQHEIEEVYDGEMAQIARVLLSIYTSELNSDKDAVRVTSSPFEGGENYERKLVFQIWSNTGKLLMRSANAPLEPLASRVNKFETIKLYGSDVRTLAVKDPTGRRIAHIGQNMVIRRENVTEILSFLLYILIFSLPLSIWLINKGLKKGIQPLNDLSGEIAGRAEHDLSPFETENTPSELKGIVTSLNKLMAQVDGTLDRERQFMADAAHELRTPLAGIKAHAQVALKNEAHQRDALVRIVSGVDRTSRLASQLLTLSSIDEVQDLQPIEEIDVNQLLDATIDDLQGYINDKSILLTTRFSDLALIKGDKDLLGILMRNLIDNAVRYSPPSSSILITSRLEQDLVTVSITDQGPGIDIDKHERVFDRFYREIDTGESGSGLGLAISRKIAILHNATIRLGQASDGPGLKVTLFFKQKNAA